jgi:hypothetical protein
MKYPRSEGAKRHCRRLFRICALQVTRAKPGRDDARLRIRKAGAPCESGTESLSLEAHDIATNVKNVTKSGCVSCQTVTVPYVDLQFEELEDRSC